MEHCLSERPARPAPAALPGRRTVLPALAAAGALVVLAVPALAQPAVQPAVQIAVQPVDQAVLTDALRNDVLRIAQEAARTAWGQQGPVPRVEVLVGALPGHLKLAPCEQVQPYLPSGVRPLGRSRIGLRCLQGPTRWNVSLPVTVRLWGPALVAAAALPAGTVVEARHLATAEVDLVERTDPALTVPASAIGRTLQRGLAAGDAVRQADLKTRQLFATGDTVRIVGIGPGYAVSSEGQALGPGLEGQNARVRTDSGRVVTGIAAGERRVEVPL